MRRLFIIRKDLNLKPGKLAAMVSHCAEAYWTNMLKNAERADIGLVVGRKATKRTVSVPMDIWDNYVHGIFTKTICECKNLNHLKKAEELICEVNSHLPDDDRLVEGKDYGYINDRCLTDLTPENPDGTCTVGMWFRPLQDIIAHKISRKYKLYGIFDENNKELAYYEVSETAYGGSDDISTRSLGKYSSYDEAKKHFWYLLENVKSNEKFAHNITYKDINRLEYNDGQKWFYQISINKKNVEDIKDAFIVNK